MEDGTSSSSSESEESCACRLVVPHKSAGWNAVGLACSCFFWEGGREIFVGGRKDYGEKFGTKGFFNLVWRIPKGQDALETVEFNGRPLAPFSLGMNVTWKMCAFFVGLSRRKKQYDSNYIRLLSMILTFILSKLSQLQRVMTYPWNGHIETTLMFLNQMIGFTESSPCRHLWDLKTMISDDPVHEELGSLALRNDWKAVLGSQISLPSFTILDFLWEVSLGSLWRVHHLSKRCLVYMPQSCCHECGSGWPALPTSSSKMYNVYT